MTLGRFDDGTFSQWDVLTVKPYINKSSAVAQMGDRLATVDMGRKCGRAAVVDWVPNRSPSNTMWPGPRHTSIPSGIFIHPTVWPQL